VTHHDDGEEQFGFEFLGVAQLAQLIEPIERLQPRLGVQIAVAADQGGPLLALVVGFQFGGQRTFGHLLALIGQPARKQSGIGQVSALDAADVIQSTCLSSSSRGPAGR